MTRKNSLSVSITDSELLALSTVSNGAPLAELIAASRLMTLEAVRVPIGAITVTLTDDQAAALPICGTVVDLPVLIAAYDQTRRRELLQQYNALPDAAARAAFMLDLVGDDLHLLNQALGRLPIDEPIKPVRPDAVTLETRRRLVDLATAASLMISASEFATVEMSEADALDGIALLRKVIRAAAALGNPD